MNRRTFLSRLLGTAAAAAIAPIAVKAAGGDGVSLYSIAHPVPPGAPVMEYIAPYEPVFDYNPVDNTLLATKPLSEESLAEALAMLRNWRLARYYTFDLDGRVTAA